MTARLTFLTTPSLASLMMYMNYSAAKAGEPAGKKVLVMCSGACHTMGDSCIASYFLRYSP